MCVERRRGNYLRFQVLGNGNTDTGEDTFTLTRTFKLGRKELGPTDLCKRSRGNRHFNMTSLCHSWQCKLLRDFIHCKPARTSRGTIFKSRRYRTPYDTSASSTQHQFLDEVTRIKMKWKNTRVEYECNQEEEELTYEEIYQAAFTLLKEIKFSPTELLTLYRREDSVCCQIYVIRFENLKNIVKCGHNQNRKDELIHSSNTLHMCLQQM